MTKYRHLKERNLEERFGSQVCFFVNKSHNVYRINFIPSISVFGNFFAKISPIGRQWPMHNQKNVLMRQIQMGMRYSTEDLTSEDYETPLKLR